MSVMVRITDFKSDIARLPRWAKVAPDCGLKYLPRDVAFGKMQAMVEGANIVRQELKAR
jgi:methionine synthase II (cobalamin-independent)